MKCTVEANYVRVYFNRHQAAPLVWCVHIQNGPEIAVSQVIFLTECQTIYCPKLTPDDEDGLPSAWMEPACRGNVDVQIDGNVARIKEAP